MSDSTTIAWTSATWNPVRGCSPVSPGCAHCYAAAMASRFSGPGRPYEGLASGGRWTGRARFVPEMLELPLRWKKPRRVFVNSMGDLFHEDVTDEQIAAVFGVMAAATQHTFQVLTKRPERMARWFRWIGRAVGMHATTGAMVAIATDPQQAIGKRVVLYPTKTKLGRLDVDAIRVWGSPDIPQDITFDIALPRRKPLRVTLRRAEQTPATREPGQEG